MTRIINCAHRGASHHAPENTLAALELALQLGATMAEIDIQQTADDELVLFHDDKLDRTSTGKGFLWKQTWEQLQHLDAGSWFSAEYEGEGIPTLEQTVAAVRDRLALNIELKMHGYERNLEELVAGRLRKLDCLDWCLVTSFDHGAVDRLSKLLPELKTGYIVGRSGWKNALLESPVSVLSLEKSLISEERVRLIHEAGKEVHAWTVNEAEDVIRFQEWGVDVLIGNDPELISQTV